MKNKKVEKGFTLIELLVVVLIIGILAAVALPQYQKAVEKSRITEVKILLKKLSDALDVYALETGNCSTDDMRELSVTMPNLSEDGEESFTKYWRIYVNDFYSGEPIEGHESGHCAQLEAARIVWDKEGDYSESVINYYVKYAGNRYDNGPYNQFFCEGDDSLCIKFGAVPNEDGQYIFP